MTFHTKHTSHLSRLELFVIYGLLTAFVICVLVYIGKFGGIFNAS